VPLCFSIVISSDVSPNVTVGQVGGQLHEYVIPRSPALDTLSRSTLALRASGLRAIEPRSRQWSITAMFPSS
jgi:hypothetical protein